MTSHTRVEAHWIHPGRLHRLQAAENKYSPSGLPSADVAVYSGILSMRRSFDAPEGLRQGSDSVTQDFLTNIYRMKQLGFNAVRLPYRQEDFNEPWNPRIIQHECQVAPAVSLFWRAHRALQASFAAVKPGGRLLHYIACCKCMHLPLICLPRHAALHSC